MTISGKILSCKHQVKDVKTLSECQAEFRPIVGVDGPLVAKIPVVLAEPVVQINVEALIPLPERVLEIKRILKDLKITQCKLVPSGRFIGDDRVYKLFLEGCVRKNIEYATVDSQPLNKRGISGDIRHTTVNVPFQCVVEVPLASDILVFRASAIDKIHIFSFFASYKMVRPYELRTNHFFVSQTHIFMFNI